MSYLIRNSQTSAPAPVEKPLVPALFRRFSQESALFVGLLLLLFWLAAMISHDVADPAWSTTGTRNYTDNWLGRVGAWVSDISYFLFGRSVWVLFAAFAGAWLRLLRSWMRGEQPRQAAAAQAQVAPGWRSRWLGWIDRRLLWWLSLFVLMAVSTGLEWARLYGSAASLPGGAGGMLGAFTGPASMLALGFLGSGVVGIVLLLLSLSWVFRFSWGRAAQSVGAFIDQRMHAARERREVAADVAAGQEAARQREELVEQERVQTQKSTRFRWWWNPRPGRRPSNPACVSPRSARNRCLPKCRTVRCRRSVCWTRHRPASRAFRTKRWR